MNHTLKLTEDTKLQDVVEALDVGGIGFLAIVDSNENLLGIITDGDLRRSILKKTTDVMHIMNQKPETMPLESSKREIIARLKKLHCRHMPLVDQSNKLHSIFFLDDNEFVSRDNTVVIMAGGLGSRLGDLTKETPKPMLNVGDRPMLQHLVEQFRDQGFSKFLFCLNYKKEVIQDFFLDGKKFGVNISYVVESKPLGTAGALALINPETFSEPFFVVNADVLTSLDFSDVLKYHLEKKSIATMCVRQIQQQIPYGVVTATEDYFIEHLNEKPIFNVDVNAGIYVLDPIALKYVPKEIHFNMTTLFETLISDKALCAMYRLSDYWVDIGHKEDLVRASEDANIKAFCKNGENR